MEIMNYQDKVAEFMRASGQLVASEPRELTKEELDFRDTLLREEIRELQYAIADNNRVEILDALCDIVYVSLGTCNTMGKTHNFEPDYDNYRLQMTPFNFSQLIHYLEFYSDYKKCFCPSSIVSVCYHLAKNLHFSLENFKTALDRVHASNMSKFTYDIKTAEKTQKFYKDQGIDTYLETREKLTTIYRQEDGKVLKSIEYHPVYLEDLV